MTKAIVNNFNATEAATEALFAENAKAVYAPLFKAVTDRETAFELFKGEKGSTAAKLAYDVQHGFRNAKGDYLIKGGLQTISQAKFFAGYTLKQLQGVKGSTLGTAYKSESIAKNAAKPKRNAETGGKRGAAADEKAPQAIEAKPGNIQEMAKQIVKTLGHKEAEKLAMAIADLVIDAGMDQPQAATA